MYELIAVVGPTATGKSRLALALAEQLDGEIISADSRQVYRCMDIGTAKPTPAERRAVPHHLIDIVDPDQDFSLAQYQALAYAAVRDIRNRRKTPLLVGGTGLYVWAVLEGWQIPRIAPDAALRQSLEAKAAAPGGAGQLYAELQKIDPAVAERIDPRNVRRVIRALEVSRAAGAPFSGLRRKRPLYNALVIGLTAERAALYRLIDARVDAMLAAGLVDEVKRLLARGYKPDLPAMSGIGYRQVIAYLAGRLTLAEAAQQIKYETHRFARHQYAWFRLGDKRIHWFDVTQKDLAEIVASVKKLWPAATQG